MSQDFNSDDDETCDASDCPICGGHTPPPLSDLEIRKLILAATTGMGHSHGEWIEQVLTAALNVRLPSRALELALSGRLLPCDFDNNGRVLFCALEQKLSPEEVAQYQSEIEEVEEDLGDPEEDLLSATERDRLTIAALAGLAEGPMPYERVEAVMQWALETRHRDRVLDAVLAGRLLPFIPDDADSVIALKEVEDLSPKQREEYQQAFADLEEQTLA